MDDLERRLQRWLSAGLISESQADAIRASEEREANSSRSVPILAEVIAYIGAIFVLSAATFVASQVWTDLRSGAQLVVVVLATGVLWAGGWLLRTGRHPMTQRLVSVLWFLSAGGLAWTADLIATGLLDIEDGYGLVIGVPLSLYTGLLFVYRRTPLQQVALASSLGLICAGLSDLAGGDDLFGLLLWLVGVGWIVLTRAGRMTPLRTGYVLGAVGLLVGSQAVALKFLETTEAEGIVLGLISAGALLYLSVAFGEMVLLGFGIAGLFLFLAQAIGEYLGDGLGGPVALFVAGIILLMVALLSLRLKQRVEVSAERQR
ncbi:MAG: DUF2157 domain-containing protein [Actinomycetota bacterium]|nr:DUF2157 domain-containing protein [Actinomycetota bacterium]